jgi:superfamily II DNA or RNA helicase
MARSKLHKAPVEDNETNRLIADLNWHRSELRETQNEIARLKGGFTDADIDYLPDDNAQCRPAEHTTPPTTPELRPYQRDIIEVFRASLQSRNRRIILVAPTGAGKTVIGASIIRKCVDNYKDVLVLAHRREIISQTSRKLHDHRVSHGIIQAGIRGRPLERVQVASIQTLHRRAIISDKVELPRADLLLIDECHHAPAKSYRKIINAYPNAVLLGLTATPCRGDGRGLGGIFEVIIECPQVLELIKQGYLVPTRVYAPTDPDLRGIRTQAGDYVETQLAERMDRPKLVGDIVTHWHKFGERRKTVCFAVSVNHSIHIRDEFVKSGVRAEHIDGSTPKLERDASLARLASGEIELITNCMVLSEGWDVPEVGCCILARPTKKMGLFRQMIGRVLRPAEGKPDAIVLDHSGAVFKHGFVEDRVAWTLDPDRRAESPQHQQRQMVNGSRLLECSQCGAIRVAGEACPHCGFLPVRPPRTVPFIDGDLGLVNSARHATGQPYGPMARALARHARPHRKRTRLQTGLGLSQIQRKIRRVANVGCFARSDSTDA